MRLRVLGGCEVTDAERRIVLRFRQAELMGLLAVRQGRVARATAAALLWPDAEVSAARHNLRQTLVALRGSGVGCVAADGESLTLRDVEVDLWELEERLAGEFPPQGIDELLPEIEAEWLTPVRAALVRSVVALCLRHGEACLERDPLRALAYADVALAQDPWLESPRSLRVRALLGSGARGLAEREVATFERDLKIEGRSRLRDLVEYETTDPLPGLPIAKLNPNEQIRVLTSLVPALGSRIQPILAKKLTESPRLGHDDRARALAALSGLAFDQGNVVLAEEHARQAVTSAVADDAQAAARLALARVMIVTNRGDEAEPLLDTALERLSPQEAERRSALLSARAAALARRHALAQSEQDSRAALALAHAVGCARLAAKARYNLASVALWGGRFEAAQREAEVGLQDLGSADPVDAGSFDLILGRILEAQGHWSKAGESYRRGVDKIRGAGNPARLAQGLTMAADLECRRGEFQGAEQAYEEAIGLWRALGDRIGLGTALRGLGQLLQTRGDLPEAERRLREAIDAYLAGGDPLGGASATLPLARLLYGSNRLQEALTFARRASDRLRNMRVSASGSTSDGSLTSESAQQLIAEIERRLSST